MEVGFRDLLLIFDFLADGEKRNRKRMNWNEIMISIFLSLKTHGCLDMSKHVPEFLFFDFDFFADEN